MSDLTERDLDVATNSKAFREDLHRLFDDLVHPGQYRMDPTSEEITLNIPIITIKTPAGLMVPEITPAKEPEILPKVEPLNGFLKMIYRQKTIDANEKAIADYEKSKERAMHVRAENALLDDANDKIRKKVSEALGISDNRVQSRSLNELQGTNTNQNHLRPTSRVNTLQPIQNEHTMS